MNILEGIILPSGEKMKAEVFVNTVVEGSTDLGYWNMSFPPIDRPGKRLTLLALLLT
jgi:hypothetical protein